MITQLYIERLPDGGYEVVCNDLMTTIPPPSDMFPEWVERLIDVNSAIEVLTARHFDECEDEDDVAGIRVGYQPMDMLCLMFHGETRIVPDFMLKGAMMRLAGDQSSMNQPATENQVEGVAV